MLVPRYRGTRDWLPADMVRFRHIEATFRSIAARYGYQEVRTPTLEYLHLFTAAGTLSPNQLAHVYSFLDWDGWSGERITLRPDGTIPAARLFLENLTRLPLGEGSVRATTTRLCYVENVFAFAEESGERERWQCGAELLGGDEVASDVELLLLACQVLEALSAGPVTLRLSHAGLLKALLRELRLSPEDEDTFLDLLLAERLSEAVQLLTDHDEAARLLPLLFGVEGEGPGFIRNLAVLTAGTWPEVAAQFERFLPLTETLTDLGRPYTIHLALDRGFEYYTGSLFHLYLQGVRVGGGGRYDDLLPLIGGDPFPSSGFALYMNPLLPMVDASSQTAPQRLQVSARGSALPHAFRLAGDLRAEGWVTELRPEPAERFTESNGSQDSTRWQAQVQESGGQVRYLVSDVADGASAVLTTPEAVLQWLQAAQS